MWRAFHVRSASVERQHHPVQTRQPERRNADRDREAAVVPVAEAEQREHVFPLRVPDPDLAVKLHQRVNARAAARLARPEPVRRARVGDRVAERERGRVLQRLVPLAHHAEHGARVAPHVRHDARHRQPLAAPLATASSGCCSTDQPSPAASIIAAADARVSGFDPAARPRPTPDAPPPNQSGARASSMR